MSGNTTTESPPPRIASIDAYRGFVMLLLLAEILQFERLAEALPNNPLLHFLAHHQSHVEWVGCSLHDLIQPSFSFLVGVSLPFSLASRAAKGQPPAQRTRHAFSRALILIVLGIFLRSMGREQTYFTFEDTLTQIGLGYGFLYLLGMRSVRTQWIALGTLLIGYWLAFALTPLPPAGFNTESVRVPANWEHNLSGFAAHWNKNTNFASHFETWFLNLFPREKPFTANGGGYVTLSFIPTLGTMLLGLLAGGVLKREMEGRERVRWLVKTGGILLVSGWLLGALGICPVVKRIWTPSWVLFSGGWCMLFLAGFYFVADVQGRKQVVYPLMVMGMNSIAAYIMSWGVTEFVAHALTRHLTHTPFRVFGENFEPLLVGIAVLAIVWWVLRGMLRQRIFLRI
jgi:predicted acyltransferase